MIVTFNKMIACLPNYKNVTNFVTCYLKKIPNKIRRYISNFFLKLGNYFKIHETILRFLRFQKMDFKMFALSFIISVAFLLENLVAIMD